MSQTRTSKLTSTTFQLQTDQSNRKNKKQSAQILPAIFQPEPYQEKLTPLNPSQKKITIYTTRNPDASIALTRVQHQRNPFQFPQTGR